ncbi:UDP-N-acetylglucosamine 2-epimerase [Amylibacter sp.]|nr:UDP-N-acetylglucosamine 2-epimerase [Amylibacter sp.]
MNKKILVFTGSRGEWGYLRPVLKKFKDTNHDVRLAVTNMHVDPFFGMTENEIIAEGFQPRYRIFMNVAGGAESAWARSLGLLGIQLPNVFDDFCPDIILLAGDRAETFMAAVSAFYSNVIIAHIQAGELSGHKDGMARHALGKLAHVHFASNEDAVDRLIRLGEQEFRIHKTGAPQLDNLLDQDEISNISDVCVKLRFNPLDRFCVCIVHPSSDETVHPAVFARIMHKALAARGLMQIWILPNNDSGSADIVNEVTHLPKQFVRVTRNLARNDYAALLSNCEFIIGNSSSGILEAPSLGVVSINIGSRQTGRLRSRTVIDVPIASAETIEQAIDCVSSRQHTGADKQYGNGDSSSKIVAVLNNLIIDDKLTNKFLVE